MSEDRTPQVPTEEERSQTSWDEGEPALTPRGTPQAPPVRTRSEEHTSELQSRGHLVCRLLLEKKKRLQKNMRGDAGRKMRDQERETNVCTCDRQKPAV